MNFTDEQYAILSQWEDNYRTAIRSQWSRSIGRTAALTIHGIYSSVVKGAPHLNHSCGSCVLRLLRNVGNLYFADKAEREEERKRKVAMADVPERTGKVLVKVRKPRKKKDE